MAKRGFLVEAVVMAAGAGARLNRAAEKPLLPLGGRPLIVHVIAAARACGAARIHIVAGKNRTLLQAALGEGADLRWAAQTRPRGTADAVLRALPGVAADAVVVALCADAPLIPAADLRRLTRAAQNGLAILSAHTDAPRGYGRILRDGRGRVVGVKEEAALSPAERAIGEINAGAIAAPAAFLRAALPKIKADPKTGEFYLTALAQSAAESGVATRAVETAAANAAGVNTLSELAAAERLWQTRAAAALMARGVILADPERLVIRGEADIGRGAFVDGGVILGGKVKIGARAVIGANCILENAAVGAGAIVRPFCHLQGCVVRAGAEVGPFARLRPGADIGRGAKVGNFVEIKNASLGAGAKANHLAYLGDAAVGAGANIGAGVVTCNYDGARKHKTRIGAGAFVGSGAELIAPVTVGKNAYIAAGSAVAADAPANKLTIARARQVVKPRKK